MQTKIPLFLSICILLMNGCVVVPVPKNFSGSAWTINSGAIENIIRDQSVPERIREIKGEIVITFKNDVCPCAGYRHLGMKVSEVDSKGVKGFEKVADDTTDYNSWVDPYVEPELCKTFTTANEIIVKAENSSTLGLNFYPPSYNLIWEAQQAMNPLECDSIRAKVLAEKAKQIAEDEGAKPLGYDITGTWLSKITSNHSDFFNKKEQRNLKLIIKEHSNHITANDSSGEATLEAYRIEGSRYDREIKFKFSSPLISNIQLEGEWKVIDGLTIQGSWKDPISTASGEWDLRKTGRKFKEEEHNKNLHKHLQNWLSQKPPIEIKWEEIKMIVVLTTGVNWQACIVVFPGWGDCIDAGSTPPITDFDYMADSIHQKLITGRIGEAEEQIKSGQQIYLENDKHWLPIHVATDVGAAQAVKLLLESGVPVDVQTNDSRMYTSLIIASRKGNTEIAKLLLESGADVNIMDNQNETALGHAQSKKDSRPSWSTRSTMYNSIVKLLIEYGASTP